MGARTIIARNSSSVNSRYALGTQNVEYELRRACRAHICKIEHSTAATARFCDELLPSGCRFSCGSNLGHILHTDAHETRPTAKSATAWQQLITESCCCCSAVLNLGNTSTALEPQLIFDILFAQIISAIHRRGPPGNACLSAHGDLDTFLHV